MPHLSQMNDGRLISCSYDGTVNIYRRYSYDIELSIKAHEVDINYFIVLKNGKILTCSDDKTMKLIKIEEKELKIEQTLLGHENIVESSIELKENLIISVAKDKSMKIWKLNNENKFECDKTIIFQENNSSCHIYRLDDNKFVTSSQTDKTIKFWNFIDYDNIENINTFFNINVICFWNHMCLIKEDILCIGGDLQSGFYLFNIKTFQYIKNILSGDVFSIYKCLNSLTLCGINVNGKVSIIKYKYDEKKQELEKYIELENAHTMIFYHSLN